MTAVPLAVFDPEIMLDASLILAWPYRPYFCMRSKSPQPKSQFTRLGPALLLAVAVGCQHSGPKEVKAPSDAAVTTQTASPESTPKSDGALLRALSPDFGAPSPRGKTHPSYQLPSKLRAFAYQPLHFADGASNGIPIRFSGHEDLPKQTGSLQGLPTKTGELRYKLRSSPTLILMENGEVLSWSDTASFRGGFPRHGSHLLEMPSNLPKDYWGERTYSEFLALIALQRQVVKILGMATSFEVLTDGVRFKTVDKDSFVVFRH